MRLVLHACVAKERALGADPSCRTAAGPLVLSCAHFAKDGRLCAAAFVQNRKSYTGCTDAANPAGENGRPWCYVEAQARDMIKC